jgi:hypothetical protein
VRLLETLARVHACSIVHRDLKPANVLVTGGGIPILLDFGLAHVDTVLSGDLAFDGQLVGTPAYFSPEQIAGERLTERTDLYVVGLLIYEALSGQRPHDGKLRHLLVARTTVPAPPLLEVAPGAPPEVASVVDAMLSRDAAQRPASALEVVRALAPGVARHPLPAEGVAWRALLASSEERPDEPLAEEALRGLFAVPDRLLHLREDAARVLWRRSGGVPRRVLDELSSWTEAGLCRAAPEGLRIDREAIDTLEIAPALVAGASPEPASEAGPGAARLRRLVPADRDGDVNAQALALAAEAANVAEELAREGRLGHAAVALAEGVRAIRDGAPNVVGALVPLLRLWTTVALLDDTPQAMDRALYESSRAGGMPGAPAELSPLERVLRAGLAVAEWSDRALDILDGITLFGDQRLERLRQRLRVSASRRCSRDRAAQTLDDAAAWAHASSDPEALAELAWWTGRISYREGRFEEAARRCAEAADRLTWTTDRVFARIHAAIAAMEAFHYEEAARWAREAAEAAAACRNALHEGLAVWVERTIAYRLDVAKAPDLELVDVASRVGSLEMLEASVRRNEAAVAWRLGDATLARALAISARDIGDRIGEAMGARMLAAALAVACGDAMTPSQLDALQRGALECEAPGVGLQVLALIGGREGRPRCDAAVAMRLAATVPRERWGERLDILSIRESLVHCGVSM